jgi:hypothetical protein
MKKVLCWLVALLIAGSIAFADTSGIFETIKKMPDKDLITTRDLLQAEVIARGLESDNKPGTFSPWYDYGLGKILPSPTLFLGHAYARDGEFMNSDFAFMESVGIMTSEEFDRYASFLIECGFKNNVDRFLDCFSAENSDGVEVVAYLTNGIMTITCQS